MQTSEVFKTSEVFYINTAIQLAIYAILPKNSLHNLSGISKNLFEMLFVNKAFSINFVFIFLPLRTDDKPAILRGDFQPADGSIIARRAGQDACDLIACECAGGDCFGSQVFQDISLFQ